MDRTVDHLTACALSRIKIARSTVRMPDDRFMPSAILMGNDVSGLSRCASRRYAKSSSRAETVGTAHDALKFKPSNSSSDCGVMISVDCIFPPFAML
ncbi:MAG: hypothetical protein E5Y58_06480 [Mesorhizobium sp.]|nr:MAG: hypothetical protein E5Y58_06480 [Mesorhizobium sp.]